MTPTETGSPTTCHVTSSDEDKSRLFVELLLDDGEHTALMDALAIDTDTEDIDDVTGWGCSVSLPRPPLNETRRAAAPAATTAAGGSSSLGGGPLRKKGFNNRQSQQAVEMDLTNMKVRCVNEDYIGDHQKSLWKANVEPGTYRYISNNGIYRSNKFASTGSDWVTAKRSRHIENNSNNNNNNNTQTTNPDVKLAQKTLRKDLNQHFRSTDNHLPPPSPHKFRESRHFNNNHHSNHKHNSHRHLQNQDNYNDADTKKHSSSAGNELSKHETDSLPPPSRPPKDPKLVKSASDLFVENFSSRMSALEKSEKESNNTNNNNTPNPRTPCSPQKSGLSSSNNNHKRHHQTDACTAAADNNVFDDISKDVFTVRPVTRAPDHPLNPLEKLTPQQKLIERASDSETSSLHTKSQPESPSLPPSFMTAMNAFAQIHSRPVPQHNHRNKDSNKAHSRSNPNTHRHPYKSSSMSNVSDPDSSINSVRNALTQTNTNIERMRMGNYGGKSPIKDYGRFLSSTRPKVAPTTHTSAFGRSLGHSINNNNNSNNNNYSNVHFNHGFIGSGGGLMGSNIHKNTVVGYKSLSTSAPVGSTLRPGNNQTGNNVIQPLVTSTTANFHMDDVSSGVSETESYLSGTSLSVNRSSGSLRDGKAVGGGAGGGGGGNNIALPGISGKRMAVATTTQRML